MSNYNFITSIVNELFTGYFTLEQNILILNIILFLNYLERKKIKVLPQIIWTDFIFWFQICANMLYCTYNLLLICIYLYLSLFSQMEGERQQDIPIQSLLSSHPHLRPMRLRTPLPSWVRARSKAPISGTGLNSLSTILKTSFSSWNCD